MNPKQNYVCEKIEKTNNFLHDKNELNGEVNKLIKHATIDSISTVKVRNGKTLSDFFNSLQPNQYNSNNDSNKKRLTQYEISKMFQQNDRLKKN